MTKPPRGSRYIYAIANRHGVIVYVGQTKRNPKVRLGEHWRRYYGPGRRPGIRWHVIILAQVRACNAARAERRWIRDLGRYNRLINRRDYRP